MYDPGKPVGFRVNRGAPPLPELSASVPTTLPNPPIKIQSESGTEIKSPVYDIELAIWNGGSEQINRDKLRRPPIVTFPHVETMLGVRILHANANDGLKVTPVSSPPGSFELSWDYLDPGSGFKIAIVYATPGEIYPPEFSYYIVAKVIDTDREIPGLSWRNIITTAGLVVIFLFFVVGVLGRSRKTQGFVKPMLAAFVLGFPAYVAYIMVKVPQPPF